MVALHLDNNTAKSYLFKQGGTASSFYSRLACHILNQSDMHVITLIPVYISIHLNVEADYLAWGRLLPEWHLPPHIVQAIFNFGVNLRWICWHPHTPINVSIITPLKIQYHQETWG